MWYKYVHTHKKNNTNNSTGTMKKYQKGYRYCTLKN